MYWLRGADRLPSKTCGWPNLSGATSPAKSTRPRRSGTGPGAASPDLVHAELVGIDETREVTVTLRDGRTVTGFPDSRQSVQGQLVLVGRDPLNPRRSQEHGPFSLDEITAIARVLIGVGRTD